MYNKSIKTNKEEFKMLQVIYTHDESDIQVIAEVATNQSLTVFEALEIAGVNMDDWADEQGWDGYDIDALSIRSQISLPEFLELAKPYVEKAIDTAEKEENIFDDEKQAYVGGWGASRIMQLRWQLENQLIDLYDSADIKQDAVKAIPDLLEVEA